jgi:hypothetical protein
MRLAIAYRSSMVLFAAADLDLFTALGSGPRTHEDLAAERGLSVEPLRMLLEACVAEGLLEAIDGGRYANTPVTEAFLVRGRPAYAAHGLEYAEDLYAPWGRLADLVRTGRPVIEPESILGDDAARTRAFVYAMHERARGLSAGSGCSTWAGDRAPTRWGSWSGRRGSPPRCSICRGSSRSRARSWTPTASRIASSCGRATI